MPRVVAHRRRGDPFVRIEREIMENPALSFKAKALYGWLLDKGEFPGGWDTDVERIATITSDGEYAIRAALVELESVGLLVRTDTTLGGRGRKAEWHLYDDTKGTENREVSEESGAEIAVVERDNRDSAPHNRETSLSETNNASFAAFYGAYPHKVGKPLAERAFGRAVKKADLATIMAGLATWCDGWRADHTETRFIPHPSTWLNGERWNDQPPPPPRSNGNGHQSKSDREWALAMAQQNLNIIDTTATERLALG
jgi:hypothetical protein